MFFALLFSSLLSPALASDTGVPVTIRVTDEAGQPIPTAVVRHPKERDRHRVHSRTGVWTGSALYFKSGDELVFMKNMMVDFEISAPGYQNTAVRYQIRKRHNVITVNLEPVDVFDDSEELEDPVIAFQRDVPLDR